MVSALNHLSCSFGVIIHPLWSVGPSFSFLLLSLPFICFPFYLRLFFLSLTIHKIIHICLYVYGLSLRSDHLTTPPFRPSADQAARNNINQEDEDMKFPIVSCRSAAPLPPLQTFDLICPSWICYGFPLTAFLFLSVADIFTAFLFSLSWLMVCGG